VPLSALPAKLGNWLQPQGTLALPAGSPWPTAANAPALMPVLLAIVATTLMRVALYVCPAVNLGLAVPVVRVPFFVLLAKLATI
jgi:hypothetical protein